MFFFLPVVVVVVADDDDDDGVGVGVGWRYFCIIGSLYDTHKLIKTKVVDTSETRYCADSQPFVTSIFAKKRDFSGYCVFFLKKQSQHRPDFEGASATGTFTAGNSHVSGGSRTTTQGNNRGSIFVNTLFGEDAAADLVFENASEQIKSCMFSPKY